MRPLHAKVGVFGMGLLGGSVALALRERFLVGELHAYDPDPQALRDATALGACDVAHGELGAWVGDLEIGVLAAPVGALVSLGSAAAAWARSGSHWTDLGSVKAPVARALTGVLPGFVGGHPMAGAEQAGMRHARAALCENAIWALTPQADTESGAMEAVRALVTALGAYPVVIAPEVHDRLVARVSHLPYLLAVALTLLVARDQERDLLMLLAAGGFRDLTRVASCSPEMSRDMVWANRGALADAKRDLQELLRSLGALLEDPDALLALAREAKGVRDGLPIVRRSLLTQLHDVVVAIPDQPGELSRVTGVLALAGVNIRDIEVMVSRDQAECLRMGFSSEETQREARRVLAGAGYQVR